MLWSRVGIILLIASFIQVESLKFSSIDVVYKKGVEAYSNERWSECIVQLEESLHLYKVYKRILINCRLKCKHDAQFTRIQDNIEDLKIYELYFNARQCLINCNNHAFEDVRMYNNVSDSTIFNMQSRKPYEYLHLCYFQMYAMSKAASASYTFLVTNPDDPKMKKNLDYYLNQPEVDINEVVDLESDDYQILYRLGLKSYHTKKWGETIANMEEALNDYLSWENNCRMECERQPEQEWSPEITITISNYMASLLICKQTCQDELKPLYNSGVEFIADLLNYIQISYYNLDRLDDMGKAVATYLLLLPNDEDMLENKKIYSTLIDDSAFVVRSDVVHYLKRDTYEKQLITFFRQENHSDDVETTNKKYTVHSLKMASDIIMNEKISIQNILFTKALPNYKIPIPTDGYKVHSCTDCGDRFLFESSLEVHINRKSFMIKYLCRYCGCLNEFFNRCQFLSHIRSHVTKTATINLSDIKVEPLPLITSVVQSSQNNQENDTLITKHFKYPCFECKDDITVTGILEKDRALHYMQTTRMVTCPVCLFTLPSSCALIAHLRIHLKTPPFICSECGAYLSLRTCMYPYNHDCDGFKMMRVTSRIKCISSTCPAIHPNNFRMHLKSCHLKKIYKCPNCYLAGYSENAVLKHVMKCCNKTKYSTYFECQGCPGNFLSSSQIHKHLDMHFQVTQKNRESQIFPCWSCGLTLSNVYDFLNHHISKHWSYTNNKILVNVIKTVKYENCDSCHKTLWYWQQSHERFKKCFYCILNGNSETIFVETFSNELNKNHNIKCHVCKIEVNENWEDIKKHYNQFHKSIKYLDLKLVVSKLNSKSFQKYANKSHNASTKKITKHFKQKKRPSTIKPLYDKININNSTKEILKKSHNCSKCNYNTEDIISFESHIKTHRDPDMAYQCMECGNCLAVKPSFSKHLLLEHNISDVEYYIKNKDCFNKTAFEKTMKVQPEENLPLEKNQCNVCRDKFIDSNSLEKHYRVHGMAFLIKNTQKSKSPQKETDN